MNIEIPESLFRRLQKCATPLLDTPITVLERWADFYEQHNPVHNIKVPEQRTDGQLPPQFDPKRPPSLLHTRVRGTFSDAPFSNWNDLVRVAHSKAMKKARSFEALRSATRAHIKKGRYEDEGYHYVPEIDMSVQGVDADRAWEHALRLAIYLHVPLRAEIEWRNKDKAAYPGERHWMSWEP